MPSDRQASAEASAARTVGGVVLAIGLASFGVLLWVCRRIAASERLWDLGDVAVLALFAAFGVFCVWAGWRLIGSVPAAAGAAAAIPSPAAAPAPSRRATLSHGFAASGVLALILSVLVPAQWHPVLLLFAGLACLVVSHALTPCEERMEKLRKARASLHQL
ncbi:MAG: hypothetical protein ACT4P3_00100 [Betaproteobacteria bacterium]